MNPTEELAVSKILKAASIPWIELDCRTQRNDKGNVTKLRFSPCLNLEEIPLAIGDLSSLEEIYLFWASRRLTCLPSGGFSRLCNLRVLQIRWCKGLRELPRLCDSLEELVIEGCNEIVDFSCFGRAKQTWTKLRCLHVIQVCARGVPSLIEAFSTEGFEDGCGDYLGKDKKTNSSSKCHSSSIFFPSLTHLSIRHSSIDQTDVARLWQFFRCCPRLTTIDLGNNRISSLQNLAFAITTMGHYTSETQVLPQMALRELNLAGNPVCSSSPNQSNNTHVDENEQVSVTDGSDSNSSIQGDTIDVPETIPVVGKGEQRQDKYLLSIITANPQLGSILVCYGNCQQIIKNNEGRDVNHHRNHRTLRNQCDCLQHSALYSPSVRHALDLNQCSRGKTLMATRPMISRGKNCDRALKTFSLSQWSLILDRTNRLFDTPSNHAQSSCHDHCTKCHACPGEIVSDANNDTNRALQERQASVIFSLLHGPVFAARENQYCQR